MARSTPRVVKDANAINKNWVSAMQNGDTQRKYKEGIDRFTGNPMQLAASDASENKFLAKIQESINTGKRKKALMDADPNLWRTNAKNVGAAGLGTGAVKKSPKQLKKAQAWQPIYQQASNNAAAVADDGGINQGKWAAAVNTMRAAKGTV